MKTIHFKLNVMENGEVIGCSMELEGEPVGGVMSIPESVAKIQDIILKVGLLVRVQKANAKV